MNGYKRSGTLSKGGKHGGKSKEGGKTADCKVADIKDFSTVPLIKQADNDKDLPKYSAVLASNSDKGVIMYDLDPLQHDLEKLLSTNALRTRFFMGEYTQTGQEDGQGKVSLKRKRPNDNRVKARDRVGLIHPFKSYIKSSSKTNPKISSPDHDHSDKFWASIEPYCGAVSPNDVIFLDSLIKEVSNAIEMKIPELGEHYANGWNEEFFSGAQNLGKAPSKKADAARGVIPMAFQMFQSLPSQLPALVKEKIKSAEGGDNNKYSDIENDIKPSALLKFKYNPGRIGACLEQRLRRDIKVLNDVNNESNNFYPDDEILAEIENCQEELLTINRYNLDELMKLRMAVMNDMRCNPLRAKLEKIDDVLEEVYNKTMERRMPDKGRDPEQNGICKFGDIEGEANAILQEQQVLNRKINNVSTMPVLY